MLAQFQSPVDTPQGLCAVLIVAVYLLCQCAVNWSTFRDACRDDSTWPRVLNAMNAVISLGLIAYVCLLIIRRATAAGALAASDSSVLSG